MKQKKTQKKAPSEPSMLDIANAPKAATQVERMMAAPGRSFDETASQYVAALVDRVNDDPIARHAIIWDADPAIDWEARCRAAEALLEKRLPRCGECGRNGSFATWTNGPFHVCDAHAEECLDRWIVDAADELRAWLALRSQ